MGWIANYKRWLDVMESGGGWYVERDGRTVALLTDPVFVETYWYSWHISPLSPDAQERGAILTQAYWHDDFFRRTVFRSREYGSECGGFWGLRPVWDERIIMRALYHPIRRPRFWDWPVLRLRRFVKRRRQRVFATRRF
jgi:hypothetical protein